MLYESHNNSTARLQKGVKKTAIVYASNEETTKCLKKRMKGSDASKIQQLTELCVDDKYLDERRDLEKHALSKVHIIATGRLIYRKGLSLLLDAVKK